MQMQLNSCHNFVNAALITRTKIGTLMHVIKEAILTNSSCTIYSREFTVTCVTYLFLNSYFAYKMIDSWKSDRPGMANMKMTE